MPSQTVYIGTYTEKLPFVDGKAEGIYVYSLNTDSGELSYLSHTTGPRNPLISPSIRRKNSSTPARKPKSMTNRRSTPLPLPAANCTRSTANPRTADCPAISSSTRRANAS